MIFGHNSNVAVGAATVHVQTEDRGISSALIETTVHWKGRVLHRRTNNYQDLLPLDASTEALLKTRVDEQHRTVIEELREGALQLGIARPTGPGSTQASPALESAASAALKIYLTNPRTWLSGRRATLELLVRDGAGNPVASATATARVEGAAESCQSTAATSSAGIAIVQFEMPKLSAGESTLVIEVVHNGGQGRLRYRLRSKAKS